MAKCYRFGCKEEGTEKIKNIKSLSFGEMMCKKHFNEYLYENV